VNPLLKKSGGEEQKQEAAVWVETGPCLVWGMKEPGENENIMDGEAPGESLAIPKTQRTEER